MPGEATDRLIAATEGLGRPRIFERSVKVGAGGIAADRGLVSVPPVDAETLARVCADLGAPQTPDFAMLLPHARSVHFGADSEIGKCYLEFAPGTAPESGLVFLAAKWRGNRMALNRYTDISGTAHDAKVALVLAEVPVPDLAPHLAALLDHARAGDPDDEAVVLKVSEEGSARLSFDISVADAGWSVARSRPLIDPLIGAIGQEWCSLPQTAIPDLLGHVAVGQDAAGAPFVTLYHGAREI